MRREESDARAQKKCTRAQDDAHSTARAIACAIACLSQSPHNPERLCVLSTYP